MKPKGSQFSQMEMFPETKTESPPPYSGDFGQQVQSGPFSSDRSRFPVEGGPDADNWVDQESLPNGMEVVKRPKEAGFSEKGVNSFSPRRDSFEWAPTWNVVTNQEAVNVNTLNERFGKLDRARHLEQPEGQETGARDDGHPMAYKYADDQYVIGDGNHRTTVEKHEGAMFHRLMVMGDYSFDTPPRKNWPDQQSKYSKGSFKP